jgi:hypothetical protein
LGVCTLYLQITTLRYKKRGRFGGNDEFCLFQQKNTMFAHLVWVLATLFAVGLAVSNLTKPASGGDNAMGYGLAMAFFALGFTVCLGILAIIIGARGGFNWVAHQPALTFILISGGLMFPIATFFCAIFKWEPGLEYFPGWVRWVSQTSVEIWLPLLLLAPMFILLDHERMASVPEMVYQWPLKAGYGISAVLCAGLFFGWMRDEMATQVAVENSEKERMERFETEQVAYLEQQTPADPLINVLSLTSPNTLDALRTVALRKVAERPNLEAELIEILADEYYHYHVYGYLARVEVAHPETLAKPLCNSIDLLANLISKSISGSNNLQDWHFDHLHIDYLLEAIEFQFEDTGTDFRPALQRLLAALDTPRPERFKDVRFGPRALLARWLDQNN